MTQGPGTKAPAESPPAPPSASPTTRSASRPLPHIHIEPPRGWTSLDLHELWAYREVLFFLTWRTIKVRYKQTVLGAAWAILQPLCAMVIFSIFFGRLAGLPSDGIPYPIFCYAALVPWTFFANGLTQASASLVNNANLVKKVYFPRLAMPLASVFAGVVDFILAFLLLLVMMLYYGVVPSLNLLWLPLFLLLALTACLGVSLWLSAMNVQFRDVRFVIPFMIQLWMFATPIAYASSIVPDAWRVVYGVNPMVGVIDGFRWALLGLDTWPGSAVFVSAGVAVALLVSGAYYFRRMEDSFADVV